MRLFRFRPLVLSILPTLPTFIIACGDDGDSKTIAIKSGDVARLEAVVADPAMADRRIELAAGTYELTKTLVLQPGQTLVGAQTYVDRDDDGVWDPIAAAADPADLTAAYAVAGSETVLDGSQRDGSSVVVMSAGSRLEKLTVRGAGKVPESANVFGDLRFLVMIDAPASDTPVAVVDTIVEQGYHAIGFSPGAVTGSFTALVEGNVLRGTKEGMVVTGIKDGADITLSLELNRNRITSGLFDGTESDQIGLVVSLSGERTKLDLVSEDNIIEKNATMGVYMAAAFTFGVTTPDIPVGPSSHGNAIHWKSTDDKIWRNGNPAANTANGGMNVQAAFDRNPDASSSDNTLTIDFVGTTFVRPGTPRAEQNISKDGPGMAPYRLDMSAFGGNFPLCTGSGDGNDVKVTFAGVTSDNDETDNPCTNDLCTSFYLFDNLVAEEGDNSVTFLPADTAAFEAANTGVKAPFHIPNILPACGTTPASP